MSVREVASALGIDLSQPEEDSRLAMCVRDGNMIITSGHPSDLKGTLGGNLGTDQGRAAARECIQKILRSVNSFNEGLEDLKVLKLLGAVNSTPDYVEHHLTLHGATDLLLQIFGPERGRHARSALGFSSLPGGAAVEIEAIFQVVGKD